MNQALFSMGCFWGVEQIFKGTPGVLATKVGYTGGKHLNPSYEEVKTGITEHAEAVLVSYDPEIVTYEDLLTVFWTNHDPTQGNRQGQDIGSQYRSVIWTYSPKQASLAEKSLKKRQEILESKITTEILEASVFYIAEEEHQDYLNKNPDAGCNI